MGAVIEGLRRLKASAVSVGAVPYPPAMQIPAQTAIVPFHVGTDYAACGHRLRHVGTDYARSGFPAHITTESLPTSRRFRCPHPLESTAHIDRNPQNLSSLPTEARCL